MRAIIRRATSLRGSVEVPGDKSISHRAVLFAALAEGRTRVEGLASGGDVRTSLACVERLGIKHFRDGDALVLDSPGRRGWARGNVALDAGNSGTTARLLMGMLAPCEGLTVTMTGDASLSRRPMRRVQQPLATMGADIALSPEGSLPATVRGTRLSGANHRLNVASAQVKTALLLAGLDADGETWVHEPSLSRDHTERLLPVFGAGVKHGEHGVGVTRTHLRAPSETLKIPGDPSAATFFAVAAALVANSEVRVANVSVNPTRTGAFEVLRAMGARCEEHVAQPAGEPWGELVAGPGLSKPQHVAGALVPRLIDEIPILAVAATQVPGETVFRDASELRVKESDRIRLVVNGLRAMGADAEELPDGLVVRGGRPLRGARIDSHMDHRIAMSFAVAGLVADGETVIEGAEWADISFPGFFQALARLSPGVVEVAK